ncbi:hypothetical protein AALO_G00238800 [Alosa alosa]|uniref:Uncharacterized protein n=1 Tax=Alosa alosa TaxID=278164 RepID=A0AAV6FX42_9TELE|nr:hypothetical protein AALO_G00238800 [Alosa alosa]
MALFHVLSPHVTAVNTCHKEVKRVQHLSLEGSSQAGVSECSGWRRVKWNSATLRWTCPCGVSLTPAEDRSRLPPSSEAESQGEAVIEHRPPLPRPAPPRRPPPLMSQRKSVPSLARRLLTVASSVPHASRPLVAPLGHFLL